MIPDLSPLLARWPQCGRALSVEPVGEPGFSGAHVFHVRTDAGRFALRRWPDDLLHTARIRELHRFLRFLQQNGIEFVAVPRADESGATIVPFDGSRWQLEPWMPGSALSPHPTPTQLANAMRALARLHIAAARYEATESGREWFFRDAARASPAVVERLCLVHDFGEDRIRILAACCRRVQPPVDELLQWYTFLAPTIARELESCAPYKVHVHPCLRDVHREHVLMNGAAVTGIVDPSAARTENVTSDVSRLLGGLSGSWDQALDAYAGIRPLSQDELRLARVLDRSGVLLSALTWVQRVAEGTRLSPRALQRMNAIQQRLQSLAMSEATRSVSFRRSRPPE